MDGFFIVQALSWTISLKSHSRALFRFRRNEGREPGWMAAFRMFGKGATGSLAATLPL